MLFKHKNSKKKPSFIKIKLIIYHQISKSTSNLQDLKKMYI
jgi:hypothetical protein